jgi:argininosuccinate lyase
MSVLSVRQTQRAWQVMAALTAAHVSAMHGEGVLDEESADSLRASVESVAHGEAPEGILLELAIAFDDRVDAICAPKLVGVTQLGRGSAEAVNAVARILTREQILQLAEDAAVLLDALLQLAGAHVVTMLPAYAGSQAVQPTTIAHYLGGAIGPLGRGIDRLLGTLDVVNLSPLGAAAVTSSRFAPDRATTASMLGFSGPVPNTFDAVSSSDYLELAASAADSLGSAIARLLHELAAWIRTAPDAFVFGEEQLMRVPDLPQIRLPAKIEHLLDLASSAATGYGAVRAWTHDSGFGPQLWLDHPLGSLLDAMETSGRFFQESAEHFSNGFEINRAVLGNRAGKGFVTSSDLADFLIVEEEISPGDAQLIANRVLAMVKDRGLEIAAIDREMVDSAGLLVLGRQIGIEFETLSKYLAPRRFLENRTAEGAPAPNSTRKWLKDETVRLNQRRATIASLRENWEQAMSELGHL